MTSPWVEGDLAFDFGNALGVQRLDYAATGKPDDMKDVDFVVEERERTLLIEVKDPSNPTIPPAELAKRHEQEVIKRLGDGLIRDLVRKARHSYMYLHLMEEDSKDIFLVVLDDPTALQIPPGLLVNFKNRLLARLRHEAKDPWKRHYVKDCLVVTPTT